MNHPTNLENLSFCRAGTVIQCISAGQLIERRTIGQLLLLKTKGHRESIFPGQPLTPTVIY